MKSVCQQDFHQGINLYPFGKFYEATLILWWFQNSTAVYKPGLPTLKFVQFSLPAQSAGSQDSEGVVTVTAKRAMACIGQQSTLFSETLLNLSSCLP